MAQPLPNTPLEFADEYLVQAASHVMSLKLEGPPEYVGLVWAVRDLVHAVRSLHTELRRYGEPTPDSDPLP
jgi:hypothetical protein